LEPRSFEIWNARQAGGRALWFYPTIGAAIAAGFPWLPFSRPACTVVGSVDLRRLDRHRGAAISSLIIEPCLPTNGRAVPTGAQWAYEEVPLI
jgi:hypothetical protein